MCWRGLIGGFRAATTEECGDGNHCQGCAARCLHWCQPLSGVVDHVPRTIAIRNPRAVTMFRSHPTRSRRKVHTVRLTRSTHRKAHCATMASEQDGHVDSYRAMCVGD
jgi:hypothetical protein